MILLDLGQEPSYSIKAYQYLSFDLGLKIPLRP